MEMKSALIIVLLLKNSSAITVTGCYLSTHHVIKSNCDDSHRKYFSIYQPIKSQFEVDHCRCTKSANCRFEVKNLSRNSFSILTKPENTKKKGCISGSDKLSIVSNHNVADAAHNVQIVCENTIHLTQNGLNCHRQKCPGINSIDTIGRNSNKITLVTINAGNALFECKNKEKVFHQHLLTEIPKKNKHLRIELLLAPPVVDLEDNCENSVTGCIKKNDKR